MASRTKFAFFFKPLVMVAASAGVALASPVAPVGEALPKPVTANRLEKPAEKVEAIRTGVAGKFLSGRFARQNQDVKKAAEFINGSLAEDPHNRGLQQDALRLNLLAGNVDVATDLAKTLAAAKENDPLIASLLMLEAVKAGDYAKAKKHISAAPEVGLFGLIRPVMLEWIALGAKESRTAVNLQAAIDKSGFFAPFITYHSALMNDLLGQSALAETGYQKSTADAATAPYRVVEAFANFYARGGKPEQAQRVFDAYAKANPSSTLLPGKLAASGTKPLVPDARAGLAEVFFTTASLLFGDEAAQDTFLYLRIALELRPNLAPGQLMLANLYEQVQDYPEAIAIYDSIEPGSVFYRRAQVRKALNLEALDEKTKAVEVLDHVAKQYADDATALITKGDLLRDSEDYTAAVAAYSAAITRSEPLKAADWPLLYARGISSERAGDWNAAEADFTRALTLAPNQPDVLNYLGYSWLVMGKNIAKAREYLDIALAARPEDAHIIDSVGWAHYLSGDFAGAVQMFERAIQMMPDDATVNDHLGDSYWRVGRQTEARYQWERALTFGPDKEAEQTLRAKLEKGLPVFTSPVTQAVNAQPANIADHAAPKRHVR
jgi:tetratricopeptide (TPR) repeat protein